MALQNRILKKLVKYSLKVKKKDKQKVKTLKECFT